MGVRVKLKRKATLKDGEAIIESEVKEYLDKTEYEKLYAKKSSDMRSLDFAIRDAKQRLEVLEKAEKRIAELPPKEKELFEMVQMALQIKELEELREKLQEMEVTYVRFKDEVDSLTPVYKKLVKSGG